MKRKRRATKSLGKLWILTAALIVLVIAGLFYLQTHNTPIHPKKNLVHKTAENVSTTKPHFDFYTILPQSKTEKTPPASFGTLSEQTKQTVTKNNTPANGKYILQIAAVKDYTDADRLKAQLTLMGYTVTIQKVTINNLIWNRVNLGPYNSLNTAQLAQSDLQKNKIKSILLKAQ